MTRLVCDCGAVYSHPDQLMYCASNRHWAGPPHDPDRAQRELSRAMGNPPPRVEPSYLAVEWARQAALHTEAANEIDEDASVNDAAEKALHLAEARVLLECADELLKALPLHRPALPNSP